MDAIRCIALTGLGTVVENSVMPPVTAWVVSQSLSVQSYLLPL